MDLKNTRVLAVFTWQIRPGLVRALVEIGGKNKACSGGNGGTTLQKQSLKRVSCLVR